MMFGGAFAPLPVAQTPSTGLSLHAAHESWRRGSGPRSTGRTWGTQPPAKQRAPPKLAGAQAHGQSYSKDGPGFSKPKGQQQGWE